jgi:hypothetical protein
MKSKNDTLSSAATDEDVEIQRLEMIKRRIDDDLYALMKDLAKATKKRSFKLKKRNHHPILEDGGF